MTITHDNVPIVILHMNGLAVLIKLWRDVEDMQDHRHVDEQRRVRISGIGQGMFYAST